MGGRKHPWAVAHPSAAGTAGVTAVAASGAPTPPWPSSWSAHGRDVRVGMSVAPRAGIGSVCVWHLRGCWRAGGRCGDVVRVFGAGSRWPTSGTGWWRSPAKPWRSPTPWQELGGMAPGGGGRDHGGGPEALTGSVWGDPGETDWAAMVPCAGGAVDELARLRRAGRLAVGGGVPRPMVVARRLASGQAVPAVALMDLRRQLGGLGRPPPMSPTWRHASPARGVWVLDGSRRPRGAVAGRG